MDIINLILVIVSGLMIVSCIVVIQISRNKVKSILVRIEEMVNAAIDGTFTENAFDESRLSAIETRLACYLSNNELEANNMKEEKDRIKELIADISHQTKTPIANILLYAQLLSEQNLPHESIPCVDALNTQAGKLNFLVTSLVKTSRLEAGIFVLHPKEDYIQSVIDSVCGQIKPSADAKEISLLIEPTQEKAYFDRKWTTESIYNIVDNAVKYTPIGGAVKIRIQAYELFCKIDITDTGIGIPEEEQAIIFQRFYRSPFVSDSDGVGIGLYLARQIITNEGGYIKVSSFPQGGTTFSVFLPQQGEMCQKC
ncbi:sensor histidine kinase [Lachnospiraceae bacterium LCP25S3_G4]